MSVCFACAMISGIAIIDLQAYGPNQAYGLHTYSVCNPVILMAEAYIGSVILVILLGFPECEAYRRFVILVSLTI